MERNSTKKPVAALITLSIFVILIVLFVFGPEKLSGGIIKSIGSEPKILTDKEPEEQKIENENAQPTSQATVSVLKTVKNYPETGKYIVADLTSMEISLFLDGKKLETYPILAKGLENSRYETPFGEYRINYKEKNHKVTVKDIYMPLSQHFWGNFFIHGKPIYGSGRELIDGPSGGCIRLSNEIAQKVYDFSEKETPVFIEEENGQSDTVFLDKISNINSTNEQRENNITADAYIVIDLKTGAVLLSKSKDEKYPLHSLTKIMTVVLADEFFRDDKEISIDPDINGEIDSRTTVTLGDRMTVSDILYPIMFENDNLATYSMATNLGSRYYGVLMDEKSKAIGMNDTHFIDPAGLNAENYSTPSDLAILSRYVYFKHPYLAKITLKNSYTLPQDNDHTSYNWTNQNTTDLSEAKFYYSASIDGRISTIVILPVQILGETRLVSIVVMNATAKNDDDIKNLLRTLSDTYSISY